SDRSAAFDAPSGEIGVIVAESAVSKGHFANDSATVAPWLAIMFAHSTVAADRAVGDRQRSIVVDAAGKEKTVVAGNCAVCNRQRAIVRDAPASTGREVGTRQTSGVIAHTTIRDSHHPPTVVDAATLASPERNVVVSRAIAVDRAIHDRHCRAAAIDGIVVDTTSSRIGIIPADNAVEDRQCRAACRTIVIDSATTVGLDRTVLHGAA